ncbi:hypothetical protein [Bacillus cereus]|uniref:hypothetical protein n=1 Tax=Bacillus cereus TaxID=1396 RepID=UPI000BF985F9|nr:hypothetical protein [Bacillus cereus]PER78728.1 hypothetical protein CN487_24895 [Bacillus cereus]
MGEIFKFSCLGIIALIVLGIIVAIEGAREDKVEAPITEIKQKVQTTMPVIKEDTKKEELEKREL